MSKENRIERRQFLSTLGKFLIAAVSVTSGGCARLIEWSSKKEQAKEKEIKDLPAEESNQKDTDKASKDSTAYPDLAVVKGEDPEKNVNRALEIMGGMGRLVKKGARVVIKPNLLTAREPQYAVTTNPIIISALVSLCYRAGASEVIVLDRPTSSATSAFEVSGIAEATQKAGGKIKILTDRNFENTSIPQGRLLKEWPLVKDVFDADVFINVPIAKTHGLATLTMAMKNLMGIMGGTRSMMHVDFDQKIVDLNSLVRPHLVVLDAYRILVKNGPTGGNLSDVKLAKTVVVGTNQATVDAYGATLFDMKPSELSYLVKAGEQEIGEIDLDKVSIVEEGF